MTATEVNNLAIVGPGRVGQALARAWAIHGVSIAGFVGRTVQSAGQAVRFARAGRVLDPSELADCDAVLLAVQDDRLATIPGQLAKQLATQQATQLATQLAKTDPQDGARPGPLWFHCSGAHDLAVLEPLRAAGCRVGSLHPLCPIPDPAVGFENLAGKPAVVQVAADDAHTEAQLHHLARAAQLVPVSMTGGDRLLYHAACVLAANGLTALYSMVEELFARALPAASVASIPPALMRGALDACARYGAVDALSGPVLRGDADLVQRQLALLATIDQPAIGAEIYRALMRRAAGMAERRGDLRGASRDAIRAVLDPESRQPHEQGATDTVVDGG